MAEQKNVYNVPVPDPEFPEPGTVADKTAPAPQDFHRFSLEQIEFLQELSKDLDYDRARKHVGWTKTQMNGILQKPKMKQELEGIFDAWRYTIRMTGEQGAARFVKILDKMESMFDAGGEDAAKIANALAKMAGDYLKATGHFDNAGGSTAPQVNISIDLGGNEAKTVKATETKEAKTVEINVEPTEGDEKCQDQWLD
jgi:hypothetical protein